MFRKCWENEEKTKEKKKTNKQSGIVPNIQNRIIFIDMVTICTTIVFIQIQHGEKGI